MLPFASWPLGATLPDSARRKPSEIPSQTRSVSAFLPGRVSVGPRSFGQFRMKSVAEGLWQSFRNGITHDLRVDQISGVNQLWGSLEFQENFANTANARFEKHGQLL